MICKLFTNNVFCNIKKKINSTCNSSKHIYCVSLYSNIKTKFARKNKFVARILNKKKLIGDYINLIIQALETRSRLSHSQPS